MQQVSRGRFTGRGVRGGLQESMEGKRGSLFIWAVMHAQSDVLGVGHGTYVKGQTQELHCRLELMCLVAGSGSWL